MSIFSFSRFKRQFNRYESHISGFFLVAGFIFDYFTLNRIDFFWDNVFIVLYLCIVGVGIVTINMYEEGKMRGSFIEHVYEFVPFLMQFSFGGLFSAFTVFYSKSGSLLSSGVFIFIMFALLIGNEFFKKRYEKLVFQLSLYFVALFSFFIFFLPVLIKQMGVLVFLGSGAISLAVIGVFIWGLSKISPVRYSGDRNFLIGTILVLYCFINLLYFTNIIPPVPLSLKIGQAYHSIQRQTDGSYFALEEKDTTWYTKFFRTTLHLESGEPAYVFSSVFAPTELNTGIVHHWYYFDTTTIRWTSVNEIPFTITGGRNDGYRVFSKKENIFPGKWRVDIETDRGQVIGKVWFNVAPPSGTSTLVAKSL